MNEPLLNLATREIMDDEIDKSVASYWVNGKWDLEFLYTALPLDILSLLNTMVLLSNGNASDSFSWDLSPSGSFSVSSAYSLSPDLGKVTNNIWGIIRKIKAPQRCIVFLWLAIQNCFMTDVERNRRGLTSNVYCPIFLVILKSRCMFRVIVRMLSWFGEAW